MVEAILVFGSIGAIYFGIGIIDMFDWKYGETPYDLLSTGLTGLFLFLALMTGVGDGNKLWAVLWLILAILLYYLSFRIMLESLKQLEVSQKDRIYALVGQFILPLGTALLILLILALLFGGGSKGRRRKK